MVEPDPAVDPAGDPGGVPEDDLGSIGPRVAEERTGVNEVRKPPLGTVPIDGRCPAAEVNTVTIEIPPAVSGKGKRMPVNIGAVGGALQAWINAAEG